MACLIPPPVSAITPSTMMNVSQIYLYMSCNQGMWCHHKQGFIIQFMIGNLWLGVFFELLFSLRISYMYTMKYDNIHLF